MTTINVDHVVAKLQVCLANYIDEIIPNHFGQNLHVFEKAHIHFLGTFIGMEAIQSLNIGLPFDKWIEIRRALQDTQPKGLIYFYKKYFDRSEFSNSFEPLNNSVVSFEDLGFLDFWDKFESNEGIVMSLLSEMYYDGFTIPIFEPKQYLFQKDRLFSFLFLKTRVFPSPEFDFYFCGYDINYCNELISKLNLEDELIMFSQSAVNFANDIRTQIIESSIYLDVLKTGFDGFKAIFPSTLEVETSMNFMQHINDAPFYLKFKLKNFYDNIRRNQGVIMKSEADFQFFFNNYTAALEVKRFLKEIFTDKKVFDTIMNDVCLQTELRENYQFCWACFGSVIELRHHDFFFKSNVSFCQDCHKLCIN